MDSLSVSSSALLHDSVPVTRSHLLPSAIFGSVARVPRPWGTPGLAKAVAGRGAPIRPGVRQASRRLVRSAGMGLTAVDAARRRWSNSFGEDEEHGVVSARPTAIVVAVSHWRDPCASAATAVERRRYLSACIESVLGLDVDQVVVAVLSNDSQQVAEDLAFDLEARFDQPTAVRILANADVLKPPFDERRQVFSIGWKPGVFTRTASRNPGFYLTWAHKAVLRRLFRDPGLSLAIYLEDDIKFTSEALDYWCRYRKPLAEIGLLPGFVRYEERDGVRYVVDQVRRQVIRQEVRLRGMDGEPTFTELDNPYQGMYVLDRPLADRHLRYSPYRGPLRSTLASGVYWLVRERAAWGPMHDDLPAGFLSRYVVPVQETGRASHRLDPMCLLEHMGRTYVDQADSRFGNFRLEDLFEVC